jgi:O-methyltransferase
MMPNALRRTRLRPSDMLRGLMARRNLAAAPVYSAWQADLAVIQKTRRRVPLLINDAAGLQLIAAVRAASRLGGAMAEVGVLMGGSARLICHAKGAAPLHLFDVFDTAQGGELPDRAAISVASHFGDVHGHEATVAELLDPFAAVHRHPGFFPNTAAGLEDERFGFVHLDIDLPEGTRSGLDFFMPRLLPGGILIGDDFQDHTLRALFRAYFADRADTFIELPWGQAMIVKQG